MGVRASFRAVLRGACDSWAGREQPALHHGYGLDWRDGARERLRGCRQQLGEFVCVCESFWKPDMDAETLFETLGQCILTGVNRDCLAGWGAAIYIITPTGITAKTLKGRQD